MHSKLLRLAVTTVTLLLTLVACIPPSSPALPPTSSSRPPPAPLPTSTTIPPPSPIDIHLVEECSVAAPQIRLPQDGVLVLTDSGLEGDLLLLDLTTLHPRRIGRAYMPFAVSPDSTRLAFIEPGEGLVIADAAGTRESTLPILFEWNGVVAWATDERLLIEDMPYFAGNIDPPASTLVLDLETRQRTELPQRAEFLKAWGAADYVPWGNASMVGTVYNPELSLAAMLWLDESDGEATSTLALIAIQGAERLAHLVGGKYSFGGGGPQWKLDGSSLYVSAPVRMETIQGIDVTAAINSDPNIPSLGGQEIFSITRDGDITRHTFLTASFPAGEDSLAVSPDGTQIAFWLNRNYTRIDQAAPQSLATLDLISNIVTDLCITTAASPASAIYWSPDGRYLAFTKEDRNNWTRLATLLDLENRVAATVADGKSVAGWMIR